MPRPSKPAKRPSRSTLPEPIAPARKRKSPPHAFVLEAIESLNPEVRHMFGGYSVYLGDKIVFMLRDNIKYPEDNGIWLVLSEIVDPASPSLRREFPSLRPIGIIGGVIGHWLLIPSDSPAFESEALHACDLLLARDPRLGRIPKSRQTRSTPRKNQR